MLNMESFSKIDSGKVFAQGESTDSPEGLYMEGTNRPLKWVAVKGYAEDWCVYTHFSERGFAFVRTNGDKVKDKHNIQKVVPCEEDVFKRYRY